MKRYYYILLLGSLLGGTLTSCNDLLDIEPPSSVTATKYFTSETDLAAFAINLYTFPSYDSDQWTYGPWDTDNGTDNQVGASTPSFWEPGQKKVGSGQGDWAWSTIRSCNYFLDNVLPKYEAGQINGSTANIKHYIGEVYTLRAYEYFKKLVNFGDCPIVMRALEDNADTLIYYSKREPRYKVAHFILDDLSKAIDLLSPTAPNSNKTRISKYVAQLLRSRAALFEGTWEKYHKGTAFVPGGPGWPGKTEDISGYDIDAEIKYFLGEAMKSAKDVADVFVGKLANNTDTREGMDANLNSINPYYTMFCDEDMSKYDEVLLWRQYALGQVMHNVQNLLATGSGGMGFTRGMINSYLMRNGLPIYAQNSEYNPEWENQGLTQTLTNRDSRIQVFNKEPGEIDYYTTAGVDTSEARQLFDGCPTGWINKKGKHYSQSMATQKQAGTSGYCIFRASEALLNYMEASYELNNNIDATADKYWRALRRRAKVNEDYNVTIAATDMQEEAKWDFGAYSHGKLIDPTLYNIRRERRDELIAEGFRWRDLKRWRSCDQFKTTPYVIQGQKYWGTIYEQTLKKWCKVNERNGTMSDPSLGDYVLPFEKVTVNNTVHNQGGWLFTPAHYLEPIGMAVFRQTASDPSDYSTSNVYQNPGWQIKADTTPSDVE